MTTPPKMQFNDLPADLKRMVFSKLARSSDLVSLCLTCKEYHELVVPDLYKTLVLDVGSKTDKRIASLLNPGNIGLKYIRNVELYKADVEHDCNMTLQAEFAIRMLLEFLPTDTLEKFSWHPWRSFSAENLKLLYKKQKRMKWLEAIALDKPINKDFVRSLKLDAVVSHATRLGLYPDSRDTLQLANELLKRLKKVEKLTLHANFAEAEEVVGMNELQDTPVEPGLITRTVFAHMLPFESCTPIVLQELCLQNVPVRYAKNTYCRIIDFSQLKTLRVFGCLGADSLFAEMCQSRSLPLSLESLEFKHDSDEEGEVVTSLNALLTLMSGLRRLYIDIGNARGGPDATSICRHASTLQELVCHSYEGDPADSDDDEHVWESDSFIKICETCTNLEQISVTFPPTPIFRMTDDYARWTKAVAKMPKLVTLNITSWPTNTQSSSRLPRKAYECLLQGTANDIFEASVEATKQRKRKAAEEARKAALPAGEAQSSDDTTSTDDDDSSTSPSTTNNELSNFLSNTNYTPLTTIAFGSSDKLFERLDPKTGIVYMRGTLQSPTQPTGHTSTAAVPVSWTARKYEESRSDILDFALLRAVRPPCRDGPGEDGLGRLHGGSPLRGLGAVGGDDDEGEDENDEEHDGGGAGVFDMRRETEELLLRLAMATDQLRRLLLIMDQA